MNMISAFIRVLAHPINRGRLFSTLVRCVWWKCNQLLFHVPVLVEVQPGYFLICRPDNSFGSYVALAKWPEYALTNFIVRYLRESDTYVDVGSHIGFELLIAASKISKGKLIGFEPTPHTFSELQQNIRANNLEARVQLFAAAVSNHVGKVSFLVESESELNHIVQSKQDASVITVPSETLHSFTRKQKLQRIHLLKIDTEGAELLVLRGAKQLLAEQRIDCILFEVNSGITVFGNSITDLLKYLEQYDYLLYSIDTESIEPTSAATYVHTKTDNLLAVRNNAVVLKRIKHLFI